MNIININNLDLTNRIKTNGCYGNIWICEEKKIIKIQCLNTGIHYNKTEDKYYMNNVNNGNRKVINKNDAIRLYYNTDFKYHFHNKHSISLDQFKNEINNQIFMATNHLAPKIYEYGITNFIDGFQYSICIMKKMKYILRNYLHIQDLSIVYDTINKVHQLGYTHGDLQSSNICIKLNSDKTKITQCKIIDWFYSKYNGDINDKEITDKLKYKDIKYFNSNVQKNRKIEKISF